MAIRIDLSHRSSTLSHLHETERPNGGTERYPEIDAGAGERVFL